MIDSHTHIHDPAFDPDRDSVIKRAIDSGVQTMITVGCDLESSHAAVALADRHEQIYATVGIHPHEAKTADDAVYKELETLAKHPRVVAWGEIGLDFFYMHSPKETQIQAFRDQIKIARSLGLPIVIHMRDSQEDTLKILKEEEAGRIGGVFHCFTGGPDAVLAAEQLNFMISISGVVTFKKATNIHEIVQKIPLNRLMVETDCPYLSPIPYRGKRNEPSYVQKVIEKIAELKPPYSTDEIAKLTLTNTQQLFQIPG